MVVDLLAWSLPAAYVVHLLDETNDERRLRALGERQLLRSGAGVASGASATRPSSLLAIPQSQAAGATRAGI
jgi:hypothetical protein